MDQQIIEIPIVKIKVGGHDQRLQVDDESLDGLVASIARVGLLYPVVVAVDGDGFLLIEGHRRFAAHKRLGRDTIGGIVQTGHEDTFAEMAFAGNFFRKDLSPVELACALKDCLVRKTMTVKELAAGFHRSEHWVHSMVAIFDWPEDIQGAIHGGAISVSAASNLACVTDDNYRRYLLDNAVLGGVTARTTAAWLQAWRSLKPPDVAVTTEPVQGAIAPPPLVPQAPCFFCSNTLPVNEMSHVPLCGACIKQIRAAT